MQQSCNARGAGCTASGEVAGTRVNKSLSLHLSLARTPQKNHIKQHPRPARRGAARGRGRVASVFLLFADVYVCVCTLCSVAFALSSAPPLRASPSSQLRLLPLLRLVLRLVRPQLHRADDWVLEVDAALLGDRLQ